MVTEEKKKYRGRKGGDKKAATPVEVKNNLLSKSYAKVLVAVGEGEFAGVPTARDIYLNGTPLESSTGLQNFGGVKWEWRSGRSDQTYIAGMPEVSNEFPVGFTLTNLTPYTRLFTNSELDATRITVAFPSLLQQQDNGDIVGYNIVYAIDVSTDGGAYVQQGQWDTNTGKTTVEYNRTHRIEFPRTGSSWTVRVRRITPNQNNAKIQDTMSVKSVAEVIDAKFRYPNTALLYVEFDAELFGGTSIPAISLKTKGRYIQVPTNYDPTTRTYSGIWNGGYKWAWSDNPAWIFYDLVTKERFGLGSRIAPGMVNKWNLYQIAQHCDVMVPDGDGGLEPRHTCNVYIQSRKEAWQVLRDIVAIFNGMLHWNGTQMIATADMPVDISTVRNYNRSNVVDGKFVYGTPSEKTVYTTAMVSFDDPENHYKTAVEPVNDLNLVRRWKTWSQAELTAIGCTSRGEAQRKGKYAMITNSLNRLVNFKLGMEGYLPAPGDVIGIADQVLAGAQLSGRISSATANSVTTDRDPTAVPGDILYINKADGVAGEGRTVLSVVGRKITTTSAFSAIPEAELTWYVEKTTLKSQLYRVTKVAWDDEVAEYTVTATQYEDSKYAAIDSGARLESRPITSIPAGGQAAPTGLTISSFTYLEQTMAVTNMSVKWNPVEGAMNYEAEWRKDGGDWLSVGLTASTGFDVRGIYKGKYQVRVRAINAINTKSIWTESANTPLDGKVGAPPTLTAFTTVPEIFGIRLNWAFQAGADDGAFIQLQEAVDINGTGLAELSFVAYPAKTYLKSNMLGGVVKFFRGRLIDRSGNQSAWTPWTYGISEYGTDKILASIVGEIERTHLGETLLSELDQTQLDLSQSKLDLGWLEAEVAGLEQQVQNEVAELNISLGELNTTVADLQDQFENIIDALEYDPTKTYTLGEIVRAGNRLYQAIKDVPVNSAPPNANFWLDVGQVVEQAGALAAQVQVNTASITQQGNTLNVQAQQLTGLTARVGTAETNISGQATALGNLQTTVTQQGNNITSQGQAITALDSRVSTSETDITGIKTVNTAQGTAITNLQTTTTTQGNTITSQGQAITSLTSSLTTTNTNVTAAQAAADAAATLAGGKGKVMVQSTTPVAADQLAQNLWIDTTGGNNTPKRWSGSAWLAVTDKIATDAAAAAANALTVANTKADATAVTSLTTRVTAAENTITSQGTSITNLNNSLSTTNTNVTTAQAAADAAATLAGGKGKVLVQSSTPVAADQLAQNLWIDTTGGNNTPKRWSGSAWLPVTDKVATDAAAAAAAAQTTANGAASATSLLTTRVTAAENTITSQGSSITQLNNGLIQFGNNSPTSVYQSLFNGKSVDTWVMRVQSATAGSTSALTNEAGNTSGSTLTLTSPASRQWWGWSNKLVRFDPNRMYKLECRMQLISAIATPATFYAGVNCFADDGVTNINITGANSVDNSHYVLASNAATVAGTWTTFTTYVRGTTTGSGGTGAGTPASPKALKEGTRYISPMIITNFAQKGGVTALDYFTIDDVTDQIQIDTQASALSGLTSTVTQQGNDITAQGQQITNVTAAVNFKEVDELYAEGETDAQIDDALRIAGGAASATTALTATVTQQGDKIVAQGQQVTELTASLTGVQNSVVGQGSAISNLQTTVTQQGNTIVVQGQSLIALDSDLTIAENNITANAGAISDLTTTVSNVDGKINAISRSVSSLTAVAREDDGSGDLTEVLNQWKTNAAVQTERIARADQDGAFAQDMTNVIAQASGAQTAADGAANKVNTVNAQVQTVATTVANLNGQVSASYSIKLAVNSNGQYYGAGMGIGIENTPAGMQSQVLFLADRFAILNSADGSASSPFVVQGGQTIVNSALIGDATIGFAKIADNIRSTNYVSGVSGWRIDKSGYFEMNGVGSGYKTLIYGNGVYITNTTTGVTVVELGVLS